MLPSKTITLPSKVSANAVCLIGNEKYGINGICMRNKGNELVVNQVGHLTEGITVHIEYMMNGVAIVLR